MESYIVCNHQLAAPKHQGTVLSLSEFIELVGSDEGLDFRFLYIDANLLDEELYKQLVSASDGITFFSDQEKYPEFIKEAVEDWSPQKLPVQSKSSQANNFLHKYVLDVRPRLFMILLIVSFVIALVVSMNYNTIPDIIRMLSMTVLVILIMYSIAALIIGGLYRGIKGGKQLTENIGGKCSSCRKWGVVKKAESEILRKDAISIKVSTQNKNKVGDVISTSEQYIPGTRTHIRQWYTCKECGERFYKDYYTDAPNV